MFRVELNDKAGVGPKDSQKKDRTPGMVGYLFLLCQYCANASQPRDATRAGEVNMLMLIAPASPSLTPTRRRARGPATGAIRQ